MVVKTEPIGARHPPPETMASPSSPSALTGSECEYRHSDIARVNPRDCWYWLNGNCLNPKCAFRHPPLDGLLGAEVPTPVGPAVPQAPVKQGVACIFFQKGFCFKRTSMPFLARTVKHR
ncbi:putative transcription factor C3H family [Helianthus annuus]|nr:putative transcription factor C3H family [Helianthus annuus]